MNALTTSETEAILTLCLIASSADGDKHERERQQLKKIKARTSRHYST